MSTTSTAAPAATPAATPLPREHGAWGLLLQAFLAGALLAREASLLLLPALALAVLGFLLKEPLILFVRHRFVWRRATPESRAALRGFVLEALAALACLALLYPWVEKTALAGLAGLGLLIGAVAVWLTATNRQRSMHLQWVSAAGLCAASLLAVLAATGGIPAWAWILWALLAAHGVASIPIVHARLELRARAATADGLRRSALFVQGGSLAAALAVLPFWPPATLPLVFSAVANFAELHRLRAPGALREPMRRVGFRLLGISLVHTAITVAVLWR
jgi:hypothetical protein